MIVQPSYYALVGTMMQRKINVPFHFNAKTESQNYINPLIVIDVGGLSATFVPLYPHISIMIWCVLAMSTQGSYHLRCIMIAVMHDIGYRHRRRMHILLTILPSKRQPVVYSGRINIIIAPSFWQHEVNGHSVNSD